MQTLAQVQEAFKTGVAVSNLGSIFSNYEDGVYRGEEGLHIVVCGRSFNEARQPLAEQLLNKCLERFEGRDFKTDLQSFLAGDIDKLVRLENTLDESDLANCTLFSHVINFEDEHCKVIIEGVGSFYQWDCIGEPDERWFSHYCSDEAREFIRVREGCDSASRETIIELFNHFIK